MPTRIETPCGFGGSDWPAFDAHLWPLELANGLFLTPASIPILGSSWSFLLGVTRAGMRCSLQARAGPNPGHTVPPCEPRYHRTD